MTLKEALMKTLGEKEDPRVGAVADTWLLAALSTSEPDAILAAYWLDKEGIWVRVTWDVEADYRRLHGEMPHVLDSSGVPKAPTSLESIMQKTATSIGERHFTEQDTTLLANQRLSWTDRRVALEARIIAERNGRCYLITNDTELVGRTGKRFGGVVEEQGLNVTIVMPSYIEQNLHHLLPELKLRLMLPSHVLAALYQLGMGGQKQDGVPYILMQRAQTYTLGGTSITADFATEVQFTENGSKKIPHRTTTYGIPAVVVSEASQGEIEKAILSLKPQIPRSITGFIFAVLPENEKFLPTFYRLKKEKAGGQLAVFYEQVRWGRLPDHTARTAGK